MSMKPVPPPSAAAAPRPSGAKKSHKQRVDKVKRIGGDALKNNRGQKKKKPDDDITKTLTSLMRTTSPIFIFMYDFVVHEDEDGRPQVAAPGHQQSERAEPGQGYIRPAGLGLNAHRQRATVANSLTNQLICTASQE
ncbi:hypothetical protein PR001_g22349 [Phytophthora rubi]|uniref:Uncharacterized protein n=1 Tax=Phytophthora rubi TaxID=129364 RepID=A0A6A3ISK9_9STRA|nr:hypothetical protein PR002_g22842 [Phytophthora rubi]KAE8987346.1 hypothetical protein PR001_g22349 [Phytophthora rubi]